MLKLCANDQSRLVVGSDCRQLDFTLKFEQAILSIVPDLFFIVVAVLRLRQLWPQTTKVAKKSSLLGILKCIFGSMLFASSVALLAIHTSTPEARNATNFTILSLSIQLIASFILLPLIFLEHTRSLSPSTRILMYTLTKGLFLSTLMRTYLYIDMLRTYPMVFHSLAINVASHFVYMLIEFVHKRDSSFIEEYRLEVRESKSSFLVRSIFLWLLPLLLRGRKSRFQLKDLKEIPEDCKASRSREPLIRALETGDRSSSFFLLRATMKSFGATFFAPVIPRLVLLLATFAQPLLLKDILMFMNDRSAPPSRGWAIFGGFVCIYGSMVLSTALYTEKVYSVIVKYRGAIVGAIYMKTLTLAAHASRPLGTGMGSNYMSVDVERIAVGIEDFHEFWSAMVALPLAFALLYSQVKWVAFIPLGFLIIAFAGTSYCAKLAGGKQTLWSKQTDARIKYISSAIRQLLPIKFFAYEAHIAHRADELRNTEVIFMKKFYSVLMWAAAISNSLMSFTVLLVIGVYAAVFGRSGTLDVSKIFTVYATIQLLAYPFNILGQFLPTILAAYASMKRIQEFLQLDEKDRQEPIIQEKNHTSTPEKPDVDDTIYIRGSFSWAKDGEPVLPQIDLKLPKGKLTICAGPVASGKTSLMLSILGELYPLSQPSETFLPSYEKVGYTSQEAFIMPGTIRDNVLFGSIYDETWYTAVISACALKVDLDRMQSGDETKVTDGRSLSGGQRQRIALARAVYTRAPLVMLDDPFSALDGETAAHVFSCLFGPDGLLKSTTVLLVTHYVHHLPSADHVIIMEKGTIIHRGTWDDVLQSGYTLSDLTRHQDTSASNGHQNQTNETADDAMRGGKHTEMIVDERDALDEVDEESKNPYLRGLQPYRFWFGHGGYLYTTCALCLYVFWPVLRLATQGYLKEWSDSATVGNYPAWIGGLAAFAFGSLFFAVIGFAFYTSLLVPRVGRSIHRQEIRGLLRASVSWIQSTPSGQMINRFSQDIYEIDFTFPIAILNGASALFVLFGVMIIIYTTSPWLTLSAPPIFLAYWFLLKFYLASSKQLQQLEAASKSPLYTVFGTTLSGLDIIRAYGAQSFFLGQNDKHLNASQGPFHYRFASLRFLRTALTLMAFFIAVGLAGTVIGLRRTTSVTFLGMALSNLTTLSLQLSQLMMSWAIIENGTISVARLQQIAELPREQGAGGAATVMKKTTSWPVHGSVVFDKVELKYGNDLPAVLKKISFTIKPGMKVGICGRTGSGKSSTVQALFRAVDSSLVKGRISIDGVDITTLPLHTLRNSMSIVTQEPFLWHDTIRRNLDVENKHSDDRIWRALEQVGIKEAVQASPEKLETVIEDSGSFSRGERQLLCLARVLLRSRRIVVLDEATSSMDLETDERVRNVVETEMKDSTVLAVAHRISTIVNFDLILVLENGEIIEADAPRILLATNSRFAQLAKSQGITSESLMGLPE